jgi:hypothetical protein
LDPSQNIAPRDHVSFYTGVPFGCVSLGSAQRTGYAYLTVTHEFDWGFASPGDLVAVQGWALPYFPDQDRYGAWVSSDVYQYRVSYYNGVLLPGTSISVVGGGGQPAAHYDVQWNGSNTLSVPSRTYLTMGMSIWTPSTGWFFDYVRPDGTLSGVGLDGNWCYFP